MEDSKMNFIKRNKILVGLILIAIIIMASILIIIFSNLSLGGNNKYGNRLDNIEEHPITSEMITDIKTEISSFEKVEDISYHLEGKLMNFIITVEDSLIEDDAKNYGNRIIETLSNEIKTYYDVQVLIDSTDEESTTYPIIGYKHKTSDMLVWKQ